jgi:type I restriction enzyme S subunit
MADGYTPYIDIKAFETGKIRQYAEISSSKLTTSEDILMVWDGARSGLVGKGLSGAIGSTIVALKPSNVLKEYLYKFLFCKYDYINTNHKGTGIPHVDPNILWDIDVPIPPIDEQKRIVDRLELLLGKINKVNERLEKIPAILKRFRQSVLSSACSGKLTADWREENDYSEWERKKAEEICFHITKGETPKEYISKDGEIPFLKVYNIRDNKLDFEYDKSFIPREIHENRMKRSRIFPNDVIMNIVGPPLQKVAIIPDDFLEGNINQAIAIFRAKDCIISKYLYLVLLCEDTLKNLLYETRGAAGQSNLSLVQCREIEIPIPPLPEQEEIVRRVDKLFALSDKIDQRYKNAKAQLARAEKSIYAKSFRGELVKQ